MLVETMVVFVMVEQSQEISAFLLAWHLTQVMRNEERVSAAQTLGTVCVFGSKPWLNYLYKFPV